MLQPAQSELDKATAIVRERERIGRTSATPERMVKAGLENVEVGVASNVQRVTDAPLDRLWKAGVITRREFEAGDRYRNDVYLAQVDPGPPTVDPNRAGGGFGPRVPSMFTSQAIADARRRVREIERRIPQNSLVYGILRSALIRENDFDDIAQSFLGRRDRETVVPVAKAGVRVALASLADHYEHMDRGHRRSSGNG